MDQCASLILVSRNEFYSIRARQVAKPDKFLPVQAAFELNRNSRSELSSISLSGLIAGLSRKSGATQVRDVEPEAVLHFFILLRVFLANICVNVEVHQGMPCNIHVASFPWHVRPLLGLL